MLAYLEGVLAENAITDIVVENQGIGYELSVPLSTADQLPTEGSRVRLYTYLHVREDQWQIFGFATRQEKDLFKLLLATVKGVGPKVALAVLSALSVNGFCQAVADNDTRTLGKISGVGKKMAERMIVELRDKLQPLATPGATGQAAPARTERGAAGLGGNPAAADAVLALETLGYRHDVASRAVAALLDEPDGAELSASELIKRSLTGLRK